MLAEWFGWISAILLALCGLPQLIKIIRTKKVNDISILSWWAWWLGEFFGIIYIILLVNSTPLLTNYVFNLGIASLVIYFYYQYKVSESYP